MGAPDDILERMRRNPKGVRFEDLCKACDRYFGEPRQRGTSHRVYKTPWPGDPRVKNGDWHQRSEAETCLSPAFQH